MVEATATRELKCDLAADVIRRFGVLRLRVNGFSMLPSIWPGDIACVSRVVAYRPGDVVLFSRKGRLFIHRVVEMSGGAVVTRGDSMLDADPPVAVSDVLGRVESIERGGSRVAVAERVSGGRRAAGAVLGQSGRLARLFECTRINLLQQIFNTLGVQHAEAEFFEFGRGSGSQTFLGPRWNRAEALLDQPAQDFPFPFHFPFLFASLFAFL